MLLQDAEFAHLQCAICTVRAGGMHDACRVEVQDVMKNRAFGCICTDHETVGLSRIALAADLFRMPNGALDCVATCAGIRACGSGFGSRGSTVTPALADAATGMAETTLSGQGAARRSSKATP